MKAPLKQSEHVSRLAWRKEKPVMEYAETIKARVPVFERFERGLPRRYFLLSGYLPDTQLA